jgi:CheY-like chemotaxis protein
MLLELCVTDRRRTHVDASSALTEIKRRTDHNDLPIGWLRAHDHKANVPPLRVFDEADAVPPVRVLLVDDDADFLESLQPLIEHQTELAVVGKAPNGLVAIELADVLEPDAVVIDLHMPIVDGVTAVARLRKDHPDLCLIALTGDSAPELHEAVSNAGADAVLLKDDLVDTLVDRLTAVRTGSRT